MPAAGVGKPVGQVGHGMTRKRAQREGAAQRISAYAVIDQ